MQHLEPHWKMCVRSSPTKGWVSPEIGLISQHVTDSTHGLDQALLSLGL
jgi:hypothetical protein